MLRWLTAGESHGPALVAVLEGLPSGVSVTTDDLAHELARRRLGHGRGARMAFERDDVSFLGGVRHGLTQGGPVAVTIGNTEWPKWETVMAADPVPPEVLEGRARNAPLTRPRPGHADLVGMHEGSALYVELPASVELVVQHTDPGLQGDRSTGGTKPAVLETGAEIQVPLFLTTGEKIKVDTRDGRYLGRINEKS